MTTGKLESLLSQRRLFVILISSFCLYAGFVLPASASSGWGLDTLLKAFARITSATALYTETRSSAFVDVPLTDQGTLVYRAPDYLAKRSTDDNSGYVVKGNIAQILGSHPPKKLHLDNYPTLAAMVAALRATLSGNTRVLHQFFKIRLTGNLTAWRLRLTPRARALSQNIALITIHGTSNRIQKIEIQENDADHSALILHHQAVHERQQTTR